MSNNIKVTAAERAEERRLKIIWEEAMYDASIERGNLRVAWKPIYRVSPYIYTFKESYGMKLLHLKLIGVELKELPLDFGENLLDLVSISLENNKLTCLPDSITKLIYLKELNISYNNIHYLPERIGYCCSLNAFPMNNNKIEELPITFGALSVLEKVDLECNCVRILPENLDHMSLCHSINLNRNQLIRLPRCLARMPSLTMLSASWNQLTYLPQELFASKSLKILRLGNNRIVSISDRMGDLKQMKELVLDYNQVTKFPLSFHKLDKLKLLRMEGNDEMIDPPTEIIIQGAKVVVNYFKEMYNSDKLTRMRHIILAVQNLLQQIADRKFADPALFEPDIQLDNASGGARNPDLWYGIQFDYFWQQMLPKLNLYWQFLHAKGLNPKDLVTEFIFSEKEVIWAFTNYSDAYGPVLRRQVTMFRRCACVNAKGEKTPCIPPRIGYMCQRECVLLKKQLIRQKDKEDRVWQAYKHDRMVDAERRAAHEAELYLESSEGKQFIESAAYEQAEELLLESGANRVIEQRLASLETEKKQIIAKYDKKINRLSKQRDIKMNKIQVELEQLKESRKLARQGYMRDGIEHRIQELTIKLAHLPETVEIKNLQQQCENDCQDAEEALYATSSSEEDSDASYSDSSLFSSDNETAAAQKWRKRRQRYLQKQQQEANLDAARKLFQSGRKVRADQLEDDKRSKSLIKKLKHELETRILDPIMVPESTEFGAKMVKMSKQMRKTWRNMREVTRMRMKRFLQKFHGHFDEVMRELKYELTRQYLAHEVQVARDKTKEEFSVIELVRESFQGVSKGKAFIAWKKWVWTKQIRIRRDRRKQYKTALRWYQAAMESVRSAQLQVDMWLPQQDIYTDRLFWLHSLTGAMTLEEPGIEHYLPSNFVIPDPPDPLPEEIPLPSSSSSEQSLSEWQRKHGTKRLYVSKASVERAKSRQSQQFKTMDSSDEEDALGIGIVSSKVPRKMRKKKSSTSSSSSKERRRRRSSEDNEDEVEDEDEGEEGEYDEEEGEEETESTSTHPTSTRRSSTTTNNTSTSGGGQSNSSSAGATSSGTTSNSGTNGSGTTSSGTGTGTGTSTSGSGSGTTNTSSLHPSHHSHSTSHSNTSSKHSLSQSQSQPHIQPQQIQQIQQQQMIVPPPPTTNTTTTNNTNSNTSILSTINTNNTTTNTNTNPNTASTHSSRSNSLSFPPLASSQTSRMSSRMSSSQTSNWDYHQKQMSKYQTVQSQLDAEKNAEETSQLTIRSHHSNLTKTQLVSPFTGNGGAGGGRGGAGKGFSLDATLQKMNTLMPLITTYSPRPTQLDDLAETNKVKSKEEYERAYKEVRRKRNQINPSRHKTYMSQANRKDRSFEQILAEAEKGKTNTNMVDIGDGVMVNAENVDFANPTEEELFRLAGGTADMLVTGKAGAELRSILAQRALHIKEKLYQKAVEKGLAPAKKTTFYDREIKPLFGEYHASSSDSEAEEEMIRRAKDGIREKRRADRVRKRQIAKNIDDFNGQED